MLVAQARGDRDELARLEEAGMLVIVALYFRPNGLFASKVRR
jgi:hypothetical protein